VLSSFLYKCTHHTQRTFVWEADTFLLESLLRHWKSGNLSINNQPPVIPFTIVFDDFEGISYLKVDICEILSKNIVLKNKYVWYHDIGTLDII
jgi:hypothetical protein